MPTWPTPHHEAHIASSQPERLPFTQASRLDPISNLLHSLLDIPLHVLRPHVPIHTCQLLRRDHAILVDIDTPERCIRLYHQREAEVADTRKDLLRYRVLKVDVCSATVVLDEVESALAVEQWKRFVAE